VHSPTEIIMTVSLVGLFADRIIAGLKSRGIDAVVMSKQLDDLWRWHNMEDSEGVKIWYVRRSLEDAIIELSKNIAAQTKLWDRIDRRLERMEETKEKLDEFLAKAKHTGDG